MANTRALLGQRTVRRYCERPVQQLVAAHALAHPDALAVSAPDGALTYGELERLSDGLAHRLRALGVERERLVGLCVERSAAMTIGGLGILKAGGVYVALDPSHPEERIALMLADCGAGALVTSEAVSDRLGATAATVITLDIGRAWDDPIATVRPTEVNGLRDLAYVIYTSGSSGAPKGVLVEHASLHALITWHQQTFAITAADRATLIASPGFDASVWELWPYLATGASVHVPADDVRIDPVALRDWIVSERITVSFLPTTLAQEILTLDWPAGSALRYLLTGGDTLYRHPRPGLPFSVVNNYGPTEATVVATSGAITASGDPRAAPSIGTPLDHVRTHIVDDRLDPVAPGAVGELLIGGDGVARGYLNRAGLTAQKFICDPFPDAPAGGRLYRTGDLVRLRPDGELDFVGRIDEQVKIRGNRIELGEISATLHLLPEIHSSVVLVNERNPGQGELASAHARLVAYMVSADGRHPDTEQLRTHLSRYLPSYMVPADFVWLEALPLTPNGKVDRAALPDITPVNIGCFAASARPSGQIEQALGDIVAALLDLQQVGVDENFFTLGGHSLLGAQLIARIRDRFDVDIGLHVLFEHPTVAGMARTVERQVIAELEAMSDDEAARLLVAGKSDR